jgi:prepilin-type N-terminal cleavage/methylation domain-containing protein/prepilin-type processing-associated H-X9-DG protein
MKEHMKKAPRQNGFTLIELLVVIGIIGVLVGILLPALSRARQEAYTIACASNLHEIGVAMNQYIAEYRGVFPPSNYYKGLGWDPVIGQIPTTPVNGYVHWSSFLYQDLNLLTSNQTFTLNSAWRVFQCPALLNGGLAPANTYSANSDGLPNEDGLTDSQLGQFPGLIDWQAPRLAYTVNEALCPRGIFQLYFSNRNNVRVYKFIQASRVKNPANVVLATELWGNQLLETSTSLIDGQTTVSGSRHPVNGINPSLTGTTYVGSAGQNAYSLPYTKNFAWATPNQLTPDPQTAIALNGASQTSTLDWVGRNHGTYKLGYVAGDSLNRLWDLRQTNFLYVDGHVETKGVSETLYPVNQWGQDFYTLDK